MAGSTRKRIAILVAGFLCGLASAAILTTPSEIDVPSASLPHRAA